MTQIELAKKGTISKEMESVIAQENISGEFLLNGLKTGTIAIPANKLHKREKYMGVGAGLLTKVNANIGTSSDAVDYGYELKKLKVSIEAGAHAVMDLSTGGDIDKMRRLVIKNSSIAVGTVPIYQAAVTAVENGKSIPEMTEKEILEGIFKHIKDGVDFITIHAGVTRNVIKQLVMQERLNLIVSRGGWFLTGWMMKNRKENPIYTHFDEILDMAREYDVTLSLGDGLRPGCTEDSTDKPQVEELIILGELTKKAWAKDVQVIIEGPGHIPLDEVEMNVQLEKKLCYNAPFYVLGPVVTDIAPGYDHITSAIGGSIAAAAGVDFLCYVTPAEHIRLPRLEDVREGVIATRIAAHVGDMVKRKDSRKWDHDMAKARISLDWKEMQRLAIDPDKFSKMRGESQPEDEDVCTMCGKFCSMKGLKPYLTGKYGNVLELLEDEKRKH
ncbi:phosphomethylpyrimidine synthase ThiC [bacterium]|nr:phosphomethylpyrimidine synthase ThiC [bacterium]